MYKISLNRIHDRVRITEGDERIELRVDADPMRMVAGLNESQRRLKTLTDESTEEQQRDAALYFAGVIFGQEQAGELLAFYHNDAACVINVCGRYFTDRLSKLIENVQRRKK